MHKIDEMITTELKLLDCLLRSVALLIKLQTPEDSLNHAVATNGVKPECLRARRARAPQQFVPQHFMPAMESNLHIGLGEGENFCGVGGAHLFQIAQHDNGPVSLR